MISYEISAIAITPVPPERVFAVLDDFSRWPSWMPAIERVKVELPAGRQPGPGYGFRLKGNVVYADLRVIEFTPLSRATSYRMSFPPLTGVNRCLVRPLDDGRYRVERVDSINLPEVVAGVLNATQRDRFNRLAQEFLDALLRVAEQEG
jgi:hypothetical protein